MSRRIRSIKPSVLDDDVAVNLTDSAWRLWVSTWALADDYGNLRMSARFIASNVWQDSARDVQPFIDELIACGRLEPYAVLGTRFAHIRNWEKHQRIDNAGKEEVPLPSKNDGSWDSAPSSRPSLTTLAGLSGGPPREGTTPPRGSECSPLDRIGEDRKGEDRKGEDNAGVDSSDQPGSSVVFGAYLRARSHKVGKGKGMAPVLTPKRRKLVTAAIKAGYTVEALQLAATGIFYSDFHAREGLNSFDYAMRESNLDRFIELAHAFAPKELVHTIIPQPPAAPRDPKDVPLTQEQMSVTGCLLLTMLDGIQAREREKEDASEAWIEETLVSRSSS